MSSFDIPPPRIDFLDANGKVSREWNRFLTNIFKRTGGSSGSNIDALAALVAALTISVNNDKIDIATGNSAAQLVEMGKDVDALKQQIGDIPAMPANILESVDFSASLLEIGKQIDEIRLQITTLPDSSAALAEANKIIATKAASTLESWNAPTLLNAWVNFGSGYNPPGYYKDPFGIVHLRGLIKSGTANTVAFSLPIGYRPANTEMFGVNASDALGRLEISSAGSVTPVTGTMSWFSFDGITFRAT